MKITRTIRCKFLPAVALVVGSLGLGACDASTTVGYGWQAIEGHGAILNSRIPVDQALDDPSLSPALRAQLLLSQQVLAFAEDQGLSVGRNYRHYAETDPRAVVYNVFATPRFALSPIENCFPMIGCVAYRGFYDLADAQAHQDSLQAQGLDTALFPIGAYSTLGLTPDPLTTAILAREPNDLVRTLLHESVHATLYIGGDTAFDEGMAEAIAQVLSFKFWASHRAEAIDLTQIQQDDAAREKSSRAMSGAAATMKDALNALYTDPALGEGEKQRRKQSLFEEFRDWQRSNRPGLAPYSYGALFTDDMNNAHLLAFSLYDDLKERLVEVLVQRFDGDLSRFLEWAKSTKGMTPDQRRQALKALSPR